MARPLIIHSHGRLVDFLDRAHIPTAALSFHHIPAVKDAIESLGIPHPEVGLILLKDTAVGLNHPLQPGETVHVYPTFSHPHIPANPIPQTPRPPRFMCDVHLGALARYLRMVGFDTRYRDPDPGDAWLAQTAGTEARVMLSRDIGLLKRRVVHFGYFPRETQPKRQLREVVALFGLKPFFRPFTRCAGCNTPLIAIHKAEVHHRLPPRVAASFDAFSTCTQCDKIFWMGSHYDRMLDMVGQL